MAPATRKIALTGGIASGKSLAGDYLRQKGIPVIDADDVVHQLLREDPELKTNIRQAFGNQVFSSAGEVDRKQLGLHVFSNQDKRKLLESWIHPKTREVIEQFHHQNQAHRLVVSIIPLLFESNLENRYDEVWLLEVPQQVQVERMMQNRGMTLEDAEARIQSQMTALEKRKRAQQHPCAHILLNIDRPDDLYQQLDTLISTHQQPS